MLKVDLEKILGFEIEATENAEFGDYSSNVALQSKGQEVKGKGRQAEARAQKIIESLKKNKELSALVDKIDVAGPGFINFWLKTDILVGNLIQIVEEKEKYGISENNKSKLAIVEYSSPNIAKPFGVGHLRSTVIGDAVANLMEATGWKVLRDNHLGDWGTQFGKVIYAIKAWGDEDKIGSSEAPVAELVKLYVKFHEEAERDEHLEGDARIWFKKLEDGDSEARRLWQKCVDWSWLEFNKVYEMLGVKFSPEFNKGRGLGESFFETRMKAVLDDLKEKNLLKSGEDGAKLVFFDKDKYPPLMIIKSDGATLYATRDLATDKYRKEKYDPDIIINEVGSEQSLYFKQLFEVEKLLGWFKEGARVHVGHGLYLTEGKKMSTRAGKTVKLEDVLSEALVRAKKLGNEDAETAKVVGVGAIKYFDLSHHPLTNINFDWESMFALEGNSGPYLQYTVARCNSVLAKSKSLQGGAFKGDTLQGRYEDLNFEELSVLRILMRFTEIVAASAGNYSPNLLCNYLYQVASIYNTFYAKSKIIESDNEEFRLALTSATGQVLKNGLKLLGIQSPERM
jgi:arginyl-tRNA synthetase